MGSSLLLLCNFTQQTERMALWARSEAQQQGNKQVIIAFSKVQKGRTKRARLRITSQNASVG